MAAHSPYEVALQGVFLTLAPQVQRAHRAPLVATGTLDVEHGSHWLTPALVKLLQLPAAGRAQPTWLDVSTHDDELIWTRRIGAVALRTRQRTARSRIVERHAAGTITFDLSVRDGALFYRQVALAIANIPVPTPLAAQVSARVSPSGAHGWHVDVLVLWRMHLVCRYAGEMCCV